MDTTETTGWESTLSHQRSKLLDTLLLVTTVGGLATLAIQYTTLVHQMALEARLWTIAPYVICLAIVAALWAWRGLNHSVRASVLILLGLALGVLALARGGLPGSGRIWLLLPLALAFVLIGPRAGFLTGSIVLIVYVIVSVAINQKWVVPAVAADLTSLSPLATEGASYLVGVVILAVLLHSFGRNWTETLRGMDMLNQRLRLQTAELEKANERLRLQTAQLQAATEIAQTCSSILNEEELLTEAARHILARLSATGVYHVGLFLLDEEHGQAVLKAATGEVGRLALEMGYQVQLDESSIIGECLTSRQPRLRSDIGARGTRFGPIPMPHTRSELVLPLRSRGTVLGALDVHSTRENAFSEPDIAVLQTIADQVAIAIDNARLFSRTETLLAEMREVQQRYMRESWDKFLSRDSAQGKSNRIDYAMPGVAVESLPAEIRNTAVKQGRPVIATVSEETAKTASQAVVVKSEQEALVMPLKLREQVIGTVALRDVQPRHWTAEELALLEVITEQIALSVDNIRLFEETQRALAETEALYRASRAIGAATSAEEVEQALLDYIARTGVDAARVASIEYERGVPAYIVMRGGWRVDEQAIQPYGVRLSLEEYPLREFINQNEPVVVEDVLSDPRANETTRALVADAAGLRSFVLVPITAGERWSGLIFAGRKQPSTFSEEIIRGYWTLAGQAAVALESMRLLEETRQRAERERLLSELSARMRASLDLESVLKTATEEIYRALGLEKVTIRLGLSDGLPKEEV